MGVATRDMTDDLDGINAQARDISFLITYARSLPDTDLSEIAVVSWSWGGISSLFASARDPHIDALVEMDGSMRYYSGLVKRAGDVHPGQMTIPLLCFTRNVSLEDLENDDVPPADKDGPNVLNAWIHGDLLKVNMLGMAHPEFSSMFQRRESAQRFAENQVADYGREDANTSYAWVALYTLNFLDAYLKHDASANAFLKRTPAENGVPKHFMGIKFSPAQKWLLCLRQRRGGQRSGWALLLDYRSGRSELAIDRACGLVVAQASAVGLDPCQSGLAGFLLGLHVLHLPWGGGPIRSASLSAGRYSSGFW